MDFPIPGVAREQHEGAGHQAAPEHAIEFRQRPVLRRGWVSAETSVTGYRFGRRGGGCDGRRGAGPSGP